MFFASFSYALATQLRITEVMVASRMQHRDLNVSWVEVTNFGHQPWNLTGASLSTGDHVNKNNSVYSEIVLQPFRSALLHSGLDDKKVDQAVREAWGLPSDTLVVGVRPFRPDAEPLHLSREATGMVTLFDAGGVLVSRVSWSSTARPGVAMQWSAQGEAFGEAVAGELGAWESSSNSSSERDVGSPALYAVAAVDAVPGSAGLDPQSGIQFGRSFVVSRPPRPDATPLYTLTDFSRQTSRPLLDPKIPGTTSHSLFEWGSWLLFAANTSQHGDEVWAWHGHTNAFFPSPPEMQFDIVSGPQSSSPAFFTAFNGSVFFAASTKKGRRELHFLSHTPGSESLALTNLDAADKQVEAGGSPAQDPYDLMHVPPLSARASPTDVGWLVFGATSAAGGTEPWFLAGSSTVPRMLADVCPGPCSSAPTGWVQWRSSLLFTADDGVHGSELWRYTGDMAGPAVLGTDLHMAADIEAGAASSSPRSGVVWRDTFLFIADTAAHGTEVWAWNGEDAPQILFEVQLGPSDSAVQALTEYHGAIFFTAIGTNSGREVWTWEGQGRPRMLFHHPPAGSSGLGSVRSGAHFWRMQGELLWAADDGRHGIEVFRTYRHPDTTDALCVPLQEQSTLGGVWDLRSTLQPVTEQACAFKLTVPDCDHCQLGYSIAVDGAVRFPSQLVATSILQNGGSGAAFVFHRLALTEFTGPKAPFQWTLAATLTGLDDQPGDACGTSTALSGPWLAVGCPAANASAGRVHMFRWGHGAWRLHSTLPPPSTMGVQPEFGAALSMHAHGSGAPTLVVGAPRADVAGVSGAGAASVWELRYGLWEHVQVLMSDTAQSSGEFGAAVGLHGGNLVIGAPGMDSGSGAAFMFIRLPERADPWAAPVKSRILPLDDSRYGHFGAKVAMDSNHFAVAAPSAASGAGAVWVYAFDADLTHVVLHERITALDGKQGDGFGASGVAVVSHPPQVVVAGPAGASAGIAGAGVYTFAEVNRKRHWWAQQAKLRPWDAETSDFPHMAVAASHSLGAFSSPGDDSAGPDAGAVHVVYPAFTAEDVGLQAEPGTAYTFPCSNAEYQATPAFIGTSPTCRACSSGPCPTGFFESAQCTESADRVCTECSPGCPVGVHTTSACGPSSDIVCGGAVSEPLPLDPLAPPDRAKQALAAGVLSVPDIQKQALKSLFSSTHGANWAAHARWPVEATGDPCSGAWHGVACDGLHNIVGLALPRVGLSGKLPSDLASTLPHLVELDISFNFLTGHLPDLSSLHNLRVLHLDHNYFLGPAPTWLATLPQLISLQLSVPDESRGLHEAPIAGSPSWPLDPLRDRGVHVVVNQRRPA